LSAVHAISAARKAAFGILLSMERGQEHSDDLLRGKDVAALSPADRNLTTALVLGVLRWQISLDMQLKGSLKKPGAKLDPAVLIALRLGAFQLLFLDRIPAHAAINESVELAKQSGHRFASGMVNAVLRSIARSGRAARSDSLEESAGVAATQAHPAWMVARWTEFYGIDAAQVICRHGQSQPPVSVRMEGPDAEAELAQAGVRLEPGDLLTAARSVVSGDVTSTSAFLEGRVRIQNEGSQLIGELAARAGDGLSQEGKSILDACAAPGGKTLIVAERNQGGRIVACESNARRLAQLRKRLAAFESRIEFRLGDATALQEESAFDLVLADVPCSGTGTLGRNPEIRHRLRPEDLVRQAERQRAILRSAVRAVRRGGRVVYSTCSLEPEENEAVVAAVLEEFHNARQISLAPDIEALERSGILTEHGAAGLLRCLTPAGALRLLPGPLPTDGFIVTMIENTT
jgi:16S rRNA (cytosine967-C5)-methyltransferase